MKYKNVVKGIFKERPNRFIAHVDINGTKEVCHVKNTGRCRELLKDGVTVYLEKSENPLRKTAYDLIAVDKNGMLFNIDSQAPNKAVAEWLPVSGLFSDIVKIKSECTYKNSRFDFYVETKNEKAFIEVKGVTLENDGIFSFPDAPTERGAKHLSELSECVKDGYLAYVIFVIQASSAEYMTPNKERDIKFYDAAEKALNSGVNIIAVTCFVEENSMNIKEEIEFRL